MSIADRIQTLRKSKGISQEELADKIGVSRQAVSKWESAQSTPDLQKIIRMAELFQVSTDYLLTGRSFETLHIQKQLSAAQDILAGLMKDLK